MFFIEVGHRDACAYRVTLQQLLRTENRTITAVHLLFGVNLSPFPPPGVKRCLLLRNRKLRISKDKKGVNYKVAVLVLAFANRVILTIA